MPLVLVALLTLPLTACAAASGQGSNSRSSTVAPLAAVGGGPDCHRAGSRRVSSATDLADALATARAGQTIVLAPGVYSGDFVTTVSGRPSAPITLCGSRRTILQGISMQRGYVLYLQDASWWRLEGFTVTGGQKGVVADGVTHDLLYGLYVHSIGDEAIHLRSFSSDNTISHCVIRQTGLLVQFFGEGIYIGSAHSNWCRYTGCRPDTSNNNKVIDNNIADTSAENIDIKEGTTGGLIMGNRLDGAGMVASAATAWVNVKGNGWTIENNIGVNSIGDGFQVHQVYPGWGVGNVFLDNHAQVNGPGYGIYVQSHDLRTVVACSNVAAGARQGLSTISCSKS
ncbi:MAG TPA: right-handed parallel beta-helix repeat-containing protein [Streptosporangiaceae bacterium]|nr:right-handed parallel beta-helix repeat-containing protein [Streptosporangiaceae bacterium]